MKISTTIIIFRINLLNTIENAWGTSPTLSWGMPRQAVRSIALEDAVAMSAEMMRVKGAETVDVDPFTGALDTRLDFCPVFSPSVHLSSVLLSYL